MKIRYAALIFTAIIGIVFIFVRNSFVKKINSVNMASINLYYNDAVNDLNNGIDYKVIEEEYDCKVIFISDADYMTNLYGNINDGNVVMDYYSSDELKGKIIFKGVNEEYLESCNNVKIKLYVIFIVIMICVYILLFFIYLKFIKPFNKLKNFAGNIAKGNFDIPLEMNKSNYFGAFTESFDIMRLELKKAKEGEFKANTSKKELVASLSHDIKTPVSTIKAICEILEFKLKDEELKSKIDIINNKADVIDELISNMFHATLEELEVLNVIPTEEPSTIIYEMFNEINHFGKINFQNELPECLILVDKLRLNQVIDNVINNSYKYANTKIDVLFENIENDIIITIKDYGTSMDKEELPLINEKFFRGSNSKGKSGSGLGLYLSCQFMKKMNGDIMFDYDNGFIVKIVIKKI